MPISLHHLLVVASDREATATYLADLLELPHPWEDGPFLALTLDDGVVVNVAAPPVEEVQPQHYAFLVDDDLFDRVRTRFDADGTEYSADPARQRLGQVGEVNDDGTGRRIYWFGPDRHMLEILTARYAEA